MKRTGTMNLIGFCGTYREFEYLSRVSFVSTKCLLKEVSPMNEN